MSVTKNHQGILLNDKCILEKGRHRMIPFMLDMKRQSTKQTNKQTNPPYNIVKQV